MLLIDDVITGFDDNKPARPCMIFRIGMPPRGGIWVIPRSTTGPPGTFVPAGALPGLNKDGWFMFLPRFVPEADAHGWRNLGGLPPRYRDQVLDNVNDAEIP